MAQSPQPKLDRPDGCDSCPININNVEGNKPKPIHHDPARLAFAMFVGIILLFSRWDAEFKPSRRGEGADVDKIVEIGGWTLKTRDADPLFFGVGFAVAAAALGISIDPLLKLLPGRRTND